MLELVFQQVLGNTCMTIVQGQVKWRPIEIVSARQILLPVSLLYEFTTQKSNQEVKASVLARQMDRTIAKDVRVIVHSQGVQSIEINHEAVVD